MMVAAEWPYLGGSSFRFDLALCFYDLLPQGYARPGLPSIGTGEDQVESPNVKCNRFPA